MQMFVGGWHKLKKFSLIQDRFDVIRKHVEGKIVLDCGSGGEEIKPDEEWWKNLFLHKKLKELAKECIGVDNDTIAIKTLTEMGYDIRFADIEQMDLGRQFDVVFAGELIEHLSNPGLFLESIKKHLIPGGKLILTTPNPWAIGNLIRAIFGRRLDINKSHVAWYDLVMLEQLLTRHGFVIEEFYWHQRVFRGVHHLVRLRPNWALNVILIAGKIG